MARKRAVYIAVSTVLAIGMAAGTLGKAQAQETGVETQKTGIGMNINDYEGTMVVHKINDTFVEFVTKEGLHGVADWSDGGAVVIEPGEYLEFNEGLPGQFIVWGYDGCGVMDLKQNVLLDLKYNEISRGEEAEWFNEGEPYQVPTDYYIVSTDKETGIADKNGDLLFMGNYKNAYSVLFFSPEATEPIGTGYEMWGEDAEGEYHNLADAQGNIMLKEDVRCELLEWDGHGFLYAVPEDEEAWNMMDEDFSSDEYLEGWQDSKDVYGYLDKNGESVLEPVWARISWDGSGFALTIDDSNGDDWSQLCGYADETGTIVLEPTYMTIYQDEYGMQLVSWNEEGELVFGYADPSGKILLEPSADYESIKYDGQGLVLEGYRYNQDGIEYPIYGYADLSGNIVFEQDYAEILHCGEYFALGHSPATGPCKYALADADGNLLTEFAYDEIFELDGEIYLVTRDADVSEIYEI